MHIFSWICSQGTRLTQGVPWAIVKGSSKSSGTFPLIRRWVLGQQQKRKEKNTGVFFSACSFVWIFFFLFFFNLKKQKSCSESGAYRCDSERRCGPWVTWWLGGRGVGVEGGPPLFTRCCCSPGLYTECPLHCNLSPGAERHTCPHTSRCLVCDREMACTACVWRILFCHSWEGTKTEPLHEKCPSYPELYHPVFSCKDQIQARACQWAEVSSP